MFQLLADDDFCCTTPVVDLKPGSSNSVLWSPPGGARPKWTQNPIVNSITATLGIFGNIQLANPPIYQILASGGVGENLEGIVPGAGGQIIVSQGPAQFPTFVTMIADGRMDSSGDLTVVGWRLKALDSTFSSPADNAIPVFTGTDWTTCVPAGDIEPTGGTSCNYAVVKGI